MGRSIKHEPELYLAQHNAICALLTGLEAGKTTEEAALLDVEARGIHREDFEMVRGWSRSERESVARTMARAIDLFGLLRF